MKRLYDERTRRTGQWRASGKRQRRRYVGSLVADAHEPCPRAAVFYIRRIRKLPQGKPAARGAAKSTLRGVIEQEGGKAISVMA